MKYHVEHKLSKRFLAAAMQEHNKHIQAFQEVLREALPEDNDFPKDVPLRIDVVEGDFIISTWEQA